MFTVSVHVCCPHVHVYVHVGVPTAITVHERTCQGYCVTITSTAGIHLIRLKHVTCTVCVDDIVFLSI